MNRSMSCLAVWLTISGLVLTVPAATAQSSQAQTLPAQRDALNLIAEFADRLCVTVPLQGELANVRASGQIQAELPGLLKKIANLGVGAAGEYQNATYEGLLREDLIEAVKDSTKCRVQVWSDLNDKLVFGRSPTQAQLGSEPAKPATNQPWSNPNPWELLGKEDFSAQSNNWPAYGWDVPKSRGSQTRTLGVHRVDATFHQSHMYKFDLPFSAALGIRMGIDVRFMPGDHTDGLTGLLFERSNGAELQYMLLADGRYALTHAMDGGRNDNVLEWVRSGVDTTQWNRLEVEIANQIVTLRLNGSIAAQYRHPDLRGGTVGYFVGSTNPGQVRVDLDNFELYRQR